MTRLRDASRTANASARRITPRGPRITPPSATPADVRSENEGCAPPPPASERPDGASAPRPAARPDNGTPGAPEDRHTRGSTPETRASRAGPPASGTRSRPRRRPAPADHGAPGAHAPAPPARRSPRSATPGRSSPCPAWSVGARRHARGPRPDDRSSRTGTRDDDARSPTRGGVNGAPRHNDESDPQAPAPTTRSGDPRPSGCRTTNGRPSACPAECRDETKTLAPSRPGDATRDPGPGARPRADGPDAPPHPRSSPARTRYARQTEPDNVTPPRAPPGPDPLRSHGHPCPIPGSLRYDRRLLTCR